MTGIDCPVDDRQAERDREFRSTECRTTWGSERHPCAGWYDASGSAWGYDTYACLCACHKEPGAQPVPPPEVDTRPDAAVLKFERRKEKPDASE